MSLHEPRLYEPATSRWLVGVAGLVLAPLSALGTWSLIFIAPRPQRLFGWLMWIVLEEIGIRATLFFGVGFLWAVTGSPRLKSLLDFAAARFAWLLIPVTVSLLVTAAWVMLFG